MVLRWSLSRLARSVLEDSSATPAVHALPVAAAARRFVPLALAPSTPVTMRLGIYLVAVVAAAVAGFG